MPDNPEYTERCLREALAGLPGVSADWTGCDEVPCFHIAEGDEDPRIVVEDRGSTLEVLTIDQRGVYRPLATCRTHEAMAQAVREELKL